MIWKPIKGFENYSISNTGLVKSIQRTVPVENGGRRVDKTINERILKPALAGMGYQFVCLSKNNIPSNKRIHKLVAEHFIGVKPDNLVINHKDGNKLNNHIDNLEYVSKQKNTQHYHISKGKAIGRVPIDHIPSIIKRIAEGEHCYKVAEEYKVTRNDIAVLCKIISISGEELTIK